MSSPLSIGLRASILASVAVISCSGRPAANPAAPSEADWTMLVYMAADDDLEQAALDNINEMAEIGSSERVNVIVQIDRAPEGRNGGGFTRSPLINLADFSSTKRLRVEHGSVVEVADLGETCTCDPAPLADFIAWGLSKYPAKRTALVLWDHGGATHGFGWDVTSGNRGLSIVDMGKGVAAGLAAAHRPRFDLLGFDACLMSNLGVVYELRRFSDVFVGSEEVEPSIGWAYAPVVRAMEANASPSMLARDIVQSFAAACLDTNASDMATLAAFDSNKVDGIVAALDDLGDRLQAKTKVAADWFPVARARTAAEQYGAGGGEQTPYATVDAVDFATGAVRALGQENQVAAAVDAATIVAYHGAGRPGAHGISLTFARQVKERLPEDDALELARRPVATWDAFLRAYLDRVSADRTTPQVLHLGVRPSPSGFEVHADLPDDDLAEAASIVGVSDVSGALTVLSLSVLPAASLASGSASFRWNRRLPAIGYGHDSVPVTIFEEPPYRDTAGQSVRIVSLTGALYREGVRAQRAEVIVFLRIPAGGALSVIGVYRYEAGGPGSEVTIHPRDTFAPSVVTVSTDGRITRTPSTTTLPFGIPSKLVLDEQPAVAGAYSVGFRVTDYAANRMWNTASVMVP